jgi:hypothetical protein
MEERWIPCCGSMTCPLPVLYLFSRWLQGALLFGRAGVRSRGLESQCSIIGIIGSGGHGLQGKRQAGRTARVGRRARPSPLLRVLADTRYQD